MPRQTKLEIAPDAPMPGVESTLYYQVPNWAAIKAIREKLTGADWCVWAYLQMIDPHGDRLKDIPTPEEIAAIVGLSEKQVNRSILKLGHLGFWEIKITALKGRNLAVPIRSIKSEPTETKLSEKAKNSKTKLSAKRQSVPEEDKVVVLETKLSTKRQSCPNRPPEPAQDKAPGSLQTIQTNLDLNQTKLDNSYAHTHEEPKTGKIDFPEEEVLTEEEIPAPQPQEQPVVTPAETAKTETTQPEQQEPFPVQNSSVSAPKEENVPGLTKKSTLPYDGNMLIEMHDRGEIRLTHDLPEFKVAGQYALADVLPNYRKSGRFMRSKPNDFKPEVLDYIAERSEKDRPFAVSWLLKMEKDISQWQALATLVEEAYKPKSEDVLPKTPTYNKKGGFDPVGAAAVIKSLFPDE